MTKKLNLDSLRIQSFVTSINTPKEKAIQGGVSLNNTCVCHSQALCSEENCTFGAPQGFTLIC